MKERNGAGRPPVWRYRAILAEECEQLGVAFDAALGRRRARRICAARYRCWSRLRAIGYSYPGIASVSGRDHTTILHGLRRLRLLNAKAAARTTIVSPKPIPLIRPRYADHVQHRIA
jgi:chromosomal replication initiation ATPase DnaA